MRVAVYRLRGEKDDFEHEIYSTILRYNGIEVIEFDYATPDLMQILRDSDAIVLKWGHSHNEHQFVRTYLPILDFQMRKRIFPDYKTCWHYDDKVKQDLLLKQAGFPFVESWLFYDKQQALDWAETASYPLVFKLAQGAGSFNVFLVKNKIYARKLIRQMFGVGRHLNTMSLAERFGLVNKNLNKLLRYYRREIYSRWLDQEHIGLWSKQKNYIYFQKFCPGNEYDTRVTTAGLRAHAFRRFVRKGDFRASGGNTWDINPENIDLRMVRLALDISKHFGFQSMAYDFVYDETGEPRIVEMSYMYGGAGYPDFMNGYWDFDLTWHPGRFWPQYFELADLLPELSLTCPELETRTGYRHAKIIGNN